jgi:hypothetical protein
MVACYFIFLAVHLRMTLVVNDLRVEEESLTQLHMNGSWVSLVIPNCNPGSFVR